MAVVHPRLRQVERAALGRALREVVPVERERAGTLVHRHRRAHLGGSQFRYRPRQDLLATHWHGLDARDGALRGKQPVRGVADAHPVRLVRVRRRRLLAAPAPRLREVVRGP